MVIVIFLTKFLENVVYYTTAYSRCSCQYKKTACVETLLAAVFFPEKQDTGEGTQKWKIFFISEFSPESKQKVKWADEYAL